MEMRSKRIIRGKGSCSVGKYTQDVLKRGTKKQFIVASVSSVPEAAHQTVYENKELAHKTFRQTMFRKH